MWSRLPPTLLSSRPGLAPAGSRFSVRHAARGARAYLAVAGGFAVEPVLGSLSTYLPGRFGGALATLANATYGKWLLGLTASGLLTYALFGFAQVRYHRV